MSSSFDAADASDLCSLHRFKNRKCKTLSFMEVTRLNEQSIDRFQHQWIMDDDQTYSSNTGVNWLIYKEGKGMFCLLCRKHDTSNNQNKSKKHNVEPAVRFKQKAVEDHANSQQHTAAITAELLSRVSTFEEEVRKIEDVKDEVYYKTLLTIYWIAEEEISNKKFTSVLELLQQVGLEDIKYLKHLSAGSVREMFLLIGSVLKAQLIHDISKAKCFGLLAHEVFDVGHQRKRLARLKEDLSENGRLQRCDLPSVTPHMEEQLNCLTTKYVDALKENIQNRFDGNHKVLTAFKVFDQTAVPKRSKAGFKQYGMADV